MSTSAEPPADPDQPPPAPFTTDVVAAEAVELARAAAVEVGGEQVGEHLGVVGDGERIVTHSFAAGLPGYVGWHWAVTVARASQAKVATVDEVVLLPGPDALLAPDWLPYARRVLPGDLGAGDLLPPEPDDLRLVPAYAADSDELTIEVATEVGLGRERVMSPEGRDAAAERWLLGAGGAGAPDTPIARQAPAHCGTCGFLLPLAGSLRAAFGVCGNEYSSVDAHVVSVEYGCGAHSQAPLVTQSLAVPTGVVYDDDQLVPITL